MNLEDKFSKLDIIKVKLEFLRTEYEQNQNALSRLDDIGFKLRTWAITICAIFAGIGFNNKIKEMFLIGVAVTIIFWIVDMYYKSLNDFNFITRAHKLEEFINSLDLESEESLNQLRQRETPAIATKMRDVGLGELCWTIKNRLHIHLIYLSLILVLLIFYAISI